MSADEGRKLTRVVQTCSAYPSQWDAWTADGQYLYLRYRHGEGCVEWHPGPDFDDSPQSWKEGRSGLLIEWDDGTDSGAISLENFLAAGRLGVGAGRRGGLRSGTRSAVEPDDKGGRSDGAEEDVAPLVVASRDGAGVLQFVDGPLDGAALLVPLLVEAWWPSAS